MVELVHTCALLALLSARVTGAKADTKTLVHSTLTKRLQDLATGEASVLQEMRLLC